MTGFPETIIETSLGKLRVWATSAHHVGFRTLDAQYEDEATRVTINSVKYRMRLDLHSADYFAAQGKEAWRSYDGGWGLESYNSPILNRDNFADATSAAYEKVRDVLVPELVKFIESHEGKRLLAHADHNKAKAEVDSAIDAVEKTRLALDEAIRRRAAAVEHLSSLEATSDDESDDDNVGVKEIADRMGVNSSAVSNWIKRDATFPAPHISLSRSSVWSWSEVRAWAISTGRMTIGGALATGGIPRTQ